MNDQELLTYAAKAAGKRIDKSEFNGGGKGNTGFDIMGNAVLDWHNMRTWNPLKNDGDALRLAVKLEMGINCMELSQFQVATYDDKGNPTYIDDSCVRRAITRAAAEIGKGM